MSGSLELTATLKLKKMKNLSIYTKKTGAGHYTVEVEKDYKKIGSFDTTDMQLIADIHEMKNDGFESELIMHDTFEEVEENVLRLAKK